MSKSQADPKLLIANRLREARTLSGLSQSQVADKMGWHRPTVSEIEAGRRNVSAEELPRLATLFGVNTGWLLGQEATPDDSVDKLLMAARELSKIKESDLERLLKVIHMLRNT